MNQCVTKTVVAGFSPAATSFIVTVYGDVVVPRGGVLWMGSLIALCASVGINESLARTAVSRLVAAGRLIGTRNGRRSHYRLADLSREEFSKAAARLYGPPQQAQDWTILHAPELSADAARRAGYGAMDSVTWLLPGWMSVQDGLGFRAVAMAPPTDLAARLWDLDGLAAEYTAMLDRFSPIVRDAMQARDGLEALTQRLALVHAFRRILLRDPELPASALPADWPGGQARALFRQAYLLLSPAADSFIGAELQGSLGVLPTETDETRSRLQRLRDS